MHSVAPKVSVLIPAYNGGQFLDDAIQSVLNQTLQNFELIIVNNNSTDETETIVAKYLCDKRIYYYKNDRTLPLHENWNKCLEYANGEYIKYLCADDKFLPTILEKYVTVMDNFPTVSLISCHKQLFHNGVDGVVVRNPLSHFQEGKLMVYATLKYFNWLGEPSMVMFRKKNLSVGGFKNYMWITDWEMWVRLLCGGDCYIVPEVLCQIRVHKDQVTKKMYKSHRMFLEEYQLYKAVLKDRKYNIDLSQLSLDPVAELKAVEMAKQAGQNISSDASAVERMKEKAEKCAKAMYRLSTKVHHAESRATFFQMLQVAVRERVVLKPVINSILSSLSLFSDKIEPLTGI